MLNVYNYFINKLFITYINFVSISEEIYSNTTIPW